MPSVVSVTGVKEVKDLLRFVDKDVAKELTVQFRKVGNIIASDARARTPRRTGASKRSIRVLQGGKKVGGGSRGKRLGGFRVVQKAKGGSIIEFAKRAPGPKNSGTPRAIKQSISLVNTLNSKYGSPGRFLWDAYDRNKAAVDGGFKSAVRDAEAKLNAKIGIIK